MRRRLLALLIAFSLLLPVLAVMAAPAAAYPGETDGVVWFTLSGPGRGCYGTLLVLYYRTVGVGCIMQSNDGSFTYINWNRTFSCYQPNGCYISFLIAGQGEGYRSEGVITQRLDDYSGTHAIITSAGSR